MLVFSKAKLVFLSVPKTGSTAYQDALEPHATILVRDPPELKHAPVFRYNRYFRPMLERFIGEGLEILAVMRDPVDWLGSWYRYRRRPFLEGHRSSTAAISFDEFVNGYTQGDQPPFAKVGAQSKFLETQRNGTAVTHLFRYDDQDGLRTFLETRLQITIETRRINVSPQMDLTLSDHAYQKLRRKFPDDFQLYESIRENGSHTPLPAKPKPD